ncbi:hypothetical protein CKA32_003169 [Geitlerinema sp. FC II]|nr:hypothetical protein CKA32_003169 [Geitlerinema sp. FC II]
MGLEIRLSLKFKKHKNSRRLVRWDRVQQSDCFKLNESIACNSRADS